MSLPIRRLVKVNSKIEQTASSSSGVSNKLFITDEKHNNDDLPIKSYSDMKSIMQDYSSSTDVYKDASVWFSQSPLPSNYLVGIWNYADLPAKLKGGKIALSISDIEKYKATGGFNININSSPYTIIPDFSDIKTFDNLISSINVSLSALNIGALCTYDALTTSILIYTTAIGNSANISYASKPTSDNDNAIVDISDILMISESKSRYLEQGSSKEDIVDFFNKIDKFNSDYYFVNINHNNYSNESVLECAKYVETQNLYFGITLDIRNSENLFIKDLLPLNLSNTCICYDDKSQYVETAAFAKFSGINYDGKNSVINPAYQQFKGIIPCDIDESHANLLDDMRVNYYTNFGKNAMFFSGTSLAENVYMDTVIYLNYIDMKLRDSEFNLLYSSDTVTDSDVINGIQIVMNHIKNVGIIDTGVVSQAMKDKIIKVTGVSDFDGVLKDGYLLYVPSEASKTYEQRANRKSVVPRLFLVGSQKINMVDIELDFVQ